MPNQMKTPTLRAAEYFQMGYSPQEVMEIMDQEKVVFPSFSGVLMEFLGKRNMSVDTLAGLSGINAASIYRFMNKERNPTRNALLRMAFAMQLSIQDTQVLLKSGNCASLSASRPRDLIIMDGLINMKYIDDVNQALIKRNMMDLSSRG